jgi:hypothetical protein
MARASRWGDDATIVVATALSRRKYPPEQSGRCTPTERRRYKAEGSKGWERPVRGTTQRSSLQSRDSAAAVLEFLAAAAWARFVPAHFRRVTTNRSEIEFQLGTVAI